MKVFRGVGASPGIALGPAFVLDAHRIKAIRRRLAPDEVAQEKERFIRAVAAVEEEFSRLIDELPQELKKHDSMLRSHIMMLKDKMVYDQTIETIEQKAINAEWALKKSLDHITALFSQIKDAYIRERLQDIRHVVQRVQEALSGTSTILDLHESDEPVIVVARDLSPADTVRMTRDKVIALVTELGSRTSHTAILARSIGIPAVVGLDGITAHLLSNDLLIVDGIKGKVIVNPEEETLQTYRRKQEQYLRYRLEIIHNSNLPAETRDGYRIKIKANMELLDEVATVIKHGAEGVGLFRTEYLYLAQRELPTEEQLYRSYREVAERLYPYPVTIRTLDIGGDKFLSDISLDDELNPALGLRAIRLCLAEQKIFRTQLRAILRASAHGNVSILFPLISGKGEILKVKELLEDVKAELDRQGLPYNREIKIGIMMEVPTAILIADILAKEVDFFSIGTNDLIQYSLAIDRVNEAVAHLYEPLHPGILRMIANATRSAHNSGIEIAMCGEMAGEPLYIPFLLGIGLDELSMNALAIPKVKRVIRESYQDECIKFANHLLELTSVEEIKQAAAEFFRQNYPQDIETTDFMAV